MKQPLTVVGFALWMGTAGAWWWTESKAPPPADEPPVPQEETATAPEDGRQAVPVTLVQAEAVRTVMRENLVTLQQIQSAMAQEDWELAAKVAAEASEAPGPGGLVPSLRKVLPKEWRALGREVHDGLGEVATALNNGATAAEVQAHMARVSASCVACHSGYRLAPAPDAEICP